MEIQGSVCKHGVSNFDSRGCWNCIVEENARLRAENAALKEAAIDALIDNISLAGIAAARKAFAASSKVYMDEYFPEMVRAYLQAVKGGE